MNKENQIRTSLTNFEVREDNGSPTIDFIHFTENIDKYST